MESQSLRKWHSIFRKWHSIFFLFSTSSVLFFCQEKFKSNSEQSVSTSEGIYEKNAAWREKIIEVCFATEADAQKLIPVFFESLKDKLATSLSTRNANILSGKMGKAISFSKSERMNIQSLIELNFPTGKSVFEFKGWKECDISDMGQFALSKVKLVLLRGQNLGNLTSSIGQSFASKEGYSANLFDQKMGIIVSFDEECQIAKNLEECKKGVTLHEFGHLLGLRHEDAHADAKADPLCRVNFATGTNESEKSSNSDALGEFPFKETLSSTSVSLKYDTQSIMNRCHLFAFFRGDKRSNLKKIELSTGDKAAIAKLNGK
jgi:hypothetical protein